MTFDYDPGDVGSASRGELLREPGNWSLFYETARNMQTQQLTGVLERHLRHLLIPRFPLDFDSRYESRVPENPEATPEPVRANLTCLRDALSRSRRQTYRRRLDAVEDGTLEFLQTPLEIAPDDGPAWFHPDLEDVPALWALKLHGFEFLAWAFSTAETAAERPALHGVFESWIRDWATADETRIGTSQYLRRAWTPHSVSLRVVNLARYYAWCVDEADGDFLAILRRLVYKNALFLANHVETDVGGNHLVENAVALVMAGTLFENEETPWIARGVSILDDASGQFLADGGHFERSPMYHTIALTRYLTVLSLLSELGRPRPAVLSRTVRRATRFLSSISQPDGRLPLLNDAVYGQALEPASCLAYARAVEESLLDTRETDAMQATGYFWLGTGEDRLLVDGGPFGPRHLPAHCHNDFFSVLLWVDGTQLLTDTGTFHYAPGPRRQYARSVRSHNTVQVGATEPVPIGGQYLAGKRLEPEVSYVRNADHTLFEGTYRRRSAPAYTHRRRVVGSGDWWLVEDTVTETGDRPVRQFLHFHPAVDLGRHPASEDGFALEVDGESLAYVLSVGADDVVRRTTPYFPEFGTERMRSALAFERNTAGTIRFLLSKEPYSREDYRNILASLDSFSTRPDGRVTPASTAP